MKKLTAKRLIFLDKRNRRYLRSKYRISKREKHNKYKRKVIKLTDPILFSIMEAPSRRRAKVKEVYKKKDYKEPMQTIQIAGDFGIEEGQDVAEFIKISSQFVDSNSRILKFDLSKCTRMWPSAVTLMCSMKHWVEMKSNPDRTP